HLLAEEASDHAVVATTATERVGHGRVRKLEDRAGVVAHPPDEERIERERNLTRAGATCRDSFADADQVADDVIRCILRQRFTDLLLTVGVVLLRLRATQERVERVDRLFVRSLSLSKGPFAKLSDDPVRTD